MPTALERFMLQERQEGKLEGKTEGRKETLISVIRNMLKDNMSMDKISKLTGLSEKEIEKLQTNE